MLVQAMLLAAQAASVRRRYPSAPTVKLLGPGCCWPHGFRPGCHASGTYGFELILCRTFAPRVPAAPKPNTPSPSEQLAASCEGRPFGAQFRSPSLPHCVAKEQNCSRHKCHMRSVSLMRAFYVCLHTTLLCTIVSQITSGLLPICVLK